MCGLVSSISVCPTLSDRWEIEDPPPTQSGLLNAKCLSVPMALEPSRELFLVPLTFSSL